MPGTRDRIPGRATASDRMRTVLQASRSVVSDLTLAGVLQRIVEAARDVSGAQYAALGVLGAQGKLEDLIHIGFDEQTVAAIGSIPQGHGLLGALIADEGPIRVADVTTDPRFRGFPSHHPQMRTFLGVSIRCRNEIFGNLYLGDRRDGHFTADDEELVETLAATAGVAIHNARLYEESHRRQEWLQASGEVSRRLLHPDTQHRNMVQMVASSVQRLSDAEAVAVVVPDTDLDTDLVVDEAFDEDAAGTGREADRVRKRLRVAMAIGVGSTELVGRTFRSAGSLMQAVMTEGTGRLLMVADSATIEPLAALPRWSGPLLVVPLIGEGAVHGAIVAIRGVGRRPFTGTDVELAAAFANQAAIAWELADSRRIQERLALLEDRDRIAHDLHDHVIQRLYATGLSLRSSIAGTDQEEVRVRAEATIADLDATIRRIRDSISELHELDDRRTLRAAVHSVISDLTPLLPQPPQLKLDGPLDTVTDDALIADAEAVLREALTNVIKHARARTVAIAISVTTHVMAITTRDDGIGVGRRRRSGLANLQQRATRRGGSLHVASQSGGGTAVVWTIRLPT